jgi:hypothetical protein
MRIRAEHGVEVARALIEQLGRTSGWRKRACACDEAATIHIAEGTCSHSGSPKPS